MRIILLISHLHLHLPHPHTPSPWQQRTPPPSSHPDSCTASHGHGTSGTSRGCCRYWDSHPESSVGHSSPAHSCKCHSHSGHSHSSEDHMPPGGSWCQSTSGRTHSAGWHTGHGCTPGDRVLRGKNGTYWSTDSFYHRNNVTYGLIDWLNLFICRSDDWKNATEWLRHAHSYSFADFITDRCIWLIGQLKMYYHWITSM